jgi:hypothetical protein
MAETPRDASTPDLRLDEGLTSSLMRVLGCKYWGHNEAPLSLTGSWEIGPEDEVIKVVSESSGEEVGRYIGSDALFRSISGWDPGVYHVYGKNEAAIALNADGGWYVFAKPTVEPISPI